MQIKEAVKEFELACSANGLSQKTIDNYVWQLSSSPNNIHSWLQTQKVAELHKVAKRHMRAYIVDLRKTVSERTGRKLSEETINDYIRTLHRFWKWCAAEYNVPNPMHGIAFPRVSEPKVKAVSMEDVEKLLESCADSDIGKRDRAIIMFLLDTGCRVAGLCGLMRSDLNLDERWASVTEKGNKTRKVTFVDFTADVLREWLAVAPREGEIFELTPSGVRQMLKRRAKAVGIKGKINPHAFRHGFAREYLQAGGDFAKLSKLMGHTHVNTTLMHYTVFSRDEITRSHEKFSPVRKLKRGNKKGSED